MIAPILLLYLYDCGHFHGRHREYTEEVDSVTTKRENVVQQGSRWLRVGTLTLTTIGPIVNMFMERMRQQAEAKRLATINEQRAQLIAEAGAEDVQTEEAEQDGFAQRLEGLSQLSRQLVTEQARQLQKQAQHWQSQARHLRKALRHESKQRRRLQKMVKQLRKAGVDLGQEIAERSEGLTGDLVAQGSKISQDWLERGSNVAHDLTERGTELGKGLAKRGSKLTRNLTERGSDLVERGSELGQDLVKRGSDVTHDLVERGGNLLQPARKRKSTFWTVFGFTTGMVVAAVLTYVFVRRRMAQHIAALDEQIELPPRNSDWHFTDASKPGGEIRHLDTNGSVATMSAVGVQQQVQQAPQAQPAGTPTDAAFAGVVGSKIYYPINELPSGAKDVIYFATLEEAQAEGYTAATK
jgi:hypothetical protein